MVKVELCGIEAIDSFVERWQVKRGRRPRFLWNVRFPDGRQLRNFIVNQPPPWRKPEDLTMLQLHVLKEADVVMGTPLDAAGNETTIDGVYTFENLTPAVADITPAADGNGFTIKAGSVANIMALVKVSADVRMGPDVNTHEETLAIALLPGEAATFSATIGNERDPV